MARIIVQVFCTGMGWVDTKHGGDTEEEAQAAEQRLLADDSAWVHPEAPRQTRLKPHSKVFTVRPGPLCDMLCEYERPVFNLSIGRMATPAEENQALGEARSATMSEINAYRRQRTPHAFLSEKSRHG